MKLDSRGVAFLMAHQRGVLSRAQAFSCGVTPDGLRHRLRRGGPWQRLLPGVYLTTSGAPTGDQLAVAAMLYAGSEGVITGSAALRNYGSSAPRTKFIDVLVPTRRQRASCSFVRLYRTSRMPTEVTCDGVLRYALAARAVADTARCLTSLAAARDVVASAVQRNCCTVQQLATELAEGPIRGSARLRAVLAEVLDGVRSVPEAEFRELIIKSGLPMPLFNPRIYIRGELLAIPDAWWPDAGVVAEIDSREWHLSPDDWERGLKRDAKLAAAGIVVVHVTPRQLRAEPARVLRDISSALSAGRPIAGVTTRPAAA